MQSVQVRVEHPTSSFPAAEQTDLAVVGCYRLTEQPPDPQVTPENILAPHRRRTLRRTQGQDAMLRIQDGTDLNFADHPGCAGLGPIGRNKRSQGTPGLPMHAALAVSGEGIPPGRPRIRYEAPDGQVERHRPLEERKTCRWLRGPGGGAGRGAPDVGDGPRGGRCHWRCVGGHIISVETRGFLSDCLVAEMTGDQLDSGNSCRLATASGRGREGQGGPSRPC